MSNKKIPNWFDGVVYDEGDVVVNSFSKEEYELNNLELSIYDLIMGINAMNIWNNNTIDLHQKALKWFRQNNPEAYMTLLD